MNRFLLTTVALLALVAAACSGGDKKSNPEPADERAATAAAPDATAEREPTEEPDASSSSSGAGVSDLFSSVFSNGFSGGGSAAAFGGGDESLLEFLPSAGDLPAGFMSAGEFTFSAPAGSSELGAVDMAMTMAMKGDPSAFAGAADPSDVDLSSLEMFVAMVMRPEDLQELGNALDDIRSLDPEQIENEINSGLGGLDGLEVERFEVLDASGLGEGGFGIEMTIDMSGLAGLFGALGGAEAGAPQLGAMTMRMYIFGRGDYVGAVMRMGFTDALGGGDEDLDIAEIIDGNLSDAPAT